MSARTHQAILRCASLLVPWEERRDWLAEWEAELWYSSCTHSRGQVLRFCFGAFRDAAWLRRNRNRRAERRVRCRSAPQCLVLLATLAAASLGFALRRSGEVTLGATGSQAAAHPVLASLALALIAVVVLRPHLSFGLGEYPAGRHPLPAATRLRRWVYLALKVILLAPIVFCGTLDVSWLLSASHIQAFGLLLAYIFAVRWALKDQRQRCPVCLRVLTHPTRIGIASQTFLEWYGTELICEKGHGLLHVPEIPGSCYAVQRWTYLDPSWRVLF